ncbi:hypothetical protein PR048_023833 [Dryococelus australis]|uniref:Histone-lysine N-methyltransferase SETMAR n=1 Tax=Dryococelus australis TaxID=614101 RepID=A0ABQ9GV70_9NEOP|nr:hypothetical protein PR048_023833 [Dryococelus australis]
MWCCKHRSDTPRSTYPKLFNKSNICLQTRTGRWLFHHENAPVRSSTVCTDYLTITGLKVMGHPPYSPDLAPSDFTLFSYVKHAIREMVSNNKCLLRGGMSCVPRSQRKL